MSTSNPLHTVLKSTQTVIMGVLNLTPDSFSDGGRFTTVELAVKHAKGMLQDGADIIDVGGESTRPGAQKVSIEEELERVIPVLKALRQELPEVPISIDTSKPGVMREALKAGAHMINDVNALQSKESLEVVASSNAYVCLMHKQGDANTMQQNPVYKDVISEVCNFLSKRANACLQVGVDASRIILDPGIGFGKTLEHNLTLLSAMPELLKMQYPILIGVSRKSLIQHALGREVGERLAASIALTVQAALKGAKILRVHDVRETYDAIRIVEMVDNAALHKHI